MKLNNKCAVITGGTMGIGLATVKRLLNEGSIVTVWDLNPDALSKAEKELKGTGKSFFHQCNVTDKNRVYQLAETANREMAG